MQLRPYQEKVLSQLNERFAAKEKEEAITKVDAGDTEDQFEIDTPEIGCALSVVEE
jgi:hypothetical protein